MIAISVPSDLIVLSTECDRPFIRHCITTWLPRRRTSVNPCCCRMRHPRPGRTRNLAMHSFEAGHEYFGMQAPLDSRSAHSRNSSTASLRLAVASRPLRLAATSSSGLRRRISPSLQNRGIAMTGHTDPQLFQVKVPALAAQCARFHARTWRPSRYPDFLAIYDKIAVLLLVERCNHGESSAVFLVVRRVEQVVARAIVLPILPVFSLSPAVEVALVSV